MERPTLLCGPAVAARAGADVAAFVAGTELLHVRLENRPRHYMWDLLVRAIGRPDLPVGRGLVFDTAQLAIQYALSGDGVALVDPALFRDEIAAGRLVAPFGLGLDSRYGYFLTIAREDLDDEAVALFRSWMIGRFAATGGGDPG